MLTTLLALTLLAQDARLTLGNGAYPIGVAFSPDGKVIAAGNGPGRAVTLWDAATGKELAKLERHLGWVTSLAFSPDGQTLFTGSYLHLDLLELQKYLHEGQEPPTDISEVIAWDVTARKHRWRQEREQGNGLCLALSPDGKVLATSWGLNSEYVRLWDPLTGKERYTFADYASGDMVRSLAFSPDGATLAAGSVSGVRLLDLAARKERSCLPGHVIHFHQVAYSRDSKAVLSVDSVGPGAETGYLRLHEAATGNLLREIKVARDVGSVASVPGKDVLAAGLYGGRILFLDAKTGKDVAEFKAHPQWAWAVAFSPDGKRMVTVGGGKDKKGGPDFHTKVWDVPELP